MIIQITALLTSIQKSQINHWQNFSEVAVVARTLFFSIMKVTYNEIMIAYIIT